MLEKEPLKLIHKKAIIHDWDETIVRTFYSVAKLIQRFGRERLGADVSLAQIQNVWGKKIPDLLSILFNYPDKDQITQAYAAYVPQGFVVQPFEGAIATLELLRSQGYFLGIVSSGKEQYIRATLESFFPDDSPFSSKRFEYSHLTSSDNSMFLKPDPRVFEGTLRVLRLLGISPEETLYIGDSLDDYYASRGLFDFVGLTSGFTIRAEFIAAGQPEHLILNSFNELPGLL